MMINVSEKGSIKLIDSITKIFQRFGSTRLLAYAMLCSTIAAILRKASDGQTLQTGMLIIAAGFLVLIIGYWFRPHDPTEKPEKEKTAEGAKAALVIAVLIGLGMVAGLNAFESPTQEQYDTNWREIQEQQDMYIYYKNLGKDALEAGDTESAIDYYNNSMEYCLFPFQKGYLQLRIASVYIELANGEFGGPWGKKFIRNALDHYIKAQEYAEQEKLERFADYKKDIIEKASRSAKACGNVLFPKSRMRQ